jgi:hypothetical protein
MKTRLFLIIIITIMIVSALAACTDEELAEWDIWGIEFTSPLPDPTPAPVCHPEFKIIDGAMVKFDWNCE